MYIVAAGIQCQLTITKITRCSNTAAVLADELSKGRFQAFRRKLPNSWELPADPASIPPSLLYWVAKPTRDEMLGQRILADIGVPFSMAAIMAAN